MVLKADLIVASACQTSIGKIDKGDEVVGFSRAFMYAGANAFVGSLWNISDEATSVMMRRFYSNINKYGIPESLRLAQIKMIQSGKYKDPYYWAAFNATGL